MKLQVLLSIASIVSVVAEDVACVDEEECRARYEALEFTGSFYSAGGVDAFPYKGCYSKNGNVFFSLGSTEDMVASIGAPLVNRIWCQSSSETTKQIVPRESFCSPTIVDIAVDDGRFATLVAALEAADLVDTLAGQGPFTVFAPTDDAFAALPDGTVEALLDDIDQLTDILTYHVVAGAVFSDDLVDGEEVVTLNGESVTVDVTFDSIMINDSTVVIPDIEACNGVIHVIDEVLIPPGGDSAGGDVDDYYPPHKPHGWWSSPSKDYHHGEWSSSSKSGKSKSSKSSSWHSDWSSKSNKSSKSGGHWSGDGWWSSSNSKKSKASWSKPSSSSHHSKPSSRSKPSSSSHRSKPSSSSHHSKKK